MCFDYAYIDNIYKKLGDDFSKDLFVNRVFYSITKDSRFIKNIISMSTEIIDLKKSGKKYMLYGAGKRGEILSELFPELWCGIVDTDQKKLGKKLNDIEIMSVAEYFEKYNDIEIVVAIKNNYRDVIGMLKEQGIDKSKIKCLSASFEQYIKGIYFDLPYLKHGDEEVFIDCGGYHGETSYDFMRWSENNYKKIIIFEPDNKNYERCKKEFEGDKNVRVYNKALWNKDEMVRFTNDGSVASRISSNENDIVVDSVKLDTVCKDEKITFIKMDLEGAERQAIEGAKTIIAKYAPKLAISVYHRDEDIIEIPKKIMGINNKYVFYIRHYTLGSSDTVLYAVPK